MGKPREAVNLTGRKCGMLTFERPTEKRRNGSIVWECVCDCGVAVEASAQTFAAKSKKSCGCLRKGWKTTELAGVLSKKFPAEYAIWSAMVARCHNPDNAGFRTYGAKGITVCNRWRSSFPAFLEDMGARPDGKSIDRKYNDLGYSPDNCEWATPEQQNRNTSRTITGEVGGKIWCLKDLAEALAINRNRISRRMKSGLSLEQAARSVVLEETRKAAA